MLVYQYFVPVTKIKSIMLSHSTLHSSYPRLSKKKKKNWAWQYISITGKEGSEPVKPDLYIQKLISNLIYNKN